jgi:ElaB/YqjD/DUF883 family membrane-anchored ribosome-binding protein
MGEHTEGIMADDTSTTSKPARPKRPAKPTAIPVAEAAAQNSPAKAIKDGASKIGKQAGDKARAYAEDGKARAGGALDELSRMMSDAAGQVDEKVGAQYGDYARSAASAISNFSESVKSKDIDALLGDAKAFVQKSPAVAIGTAAAIGFVIARLIKSGIDANDGEA